MSGRHGELVTKVKDFEDQGWVIPVSGSLRMSRGGIYRWSLQIVRKCPHRPQMQFGIHGLNHEKPWRLVTTSRCSRSKDDDPWQDRPGGDRLIDQGDMVHVLVDMRQEATNRPNIDRQEKIHRGILRGLRIISETVKQGYEISPVTGKMGYLSPPQTCGR